MKHSFWMYKKYNKQTMITRLASAEYNIIKFCLSFTQGDLSQFLLECKVS